MDVPQKLIDRLGEPSRIGYEWVTWDIPNETASNPVIVWRQGMTSALNKVNGERYPAGASGMRLAPESFLKDTGPWVALMESPSLECFEYLLSRGLSPDEMSSFFSHPEDYSRVFAKIEEDGEMVGWQARDLTGAGLHKYVAGRTQDGWQPAHRSLYGIDRVRSGYPCWIVEGVFDTFFFPRAVAVLGSNISRVQAVKVIDRLPSHIYIAADEVRLSIKWSKMFKMHDIPTTIVTPPLHGDWGELVSKEMRYGFEESQE